MNENKILTERGTNELQVVIFSINKEKYAVNIAKVLEIIKPTPVTEVPMSHKYIKGLIKPRENIIPLIDLRKVFNKESDNMSEHYIILKFNASYMAIEVDKVIGIKTFTWNDVEDVNDLIKTKYANSVIKDEKDIIITLDFENIYYDVNGDIAVNVKIDKTKKDFRVGKKILFAEDSNTMAVFVKDALIEAGYTNITHCNNGEIAYKAFKDNSFDLIISDIEMPKMDGYTLTKKIKSDNGKMPVILFSSIDTNQDAIKQTGADGFITKPKLVELIEIIDRFLIK